MEPPWELTGPRRRLEASAPAPEMRVGWSLWMEAGAVGAQRGSSGPGEQPGSLLLSHSFSVLWARGARAVGTVQRDKYLGRVTKCCGSQRAEVSH